MSQSIRNQHLSGSLVKALKSISPERVQEIRDQGERLAASPHWVHSQESIASAAQRGSIGELDGTNCR